MFVLCDTSSVLMLLRIAPEMFADPCFECVTIPEVRNEIFRTQKFKNKYAWREKYKNKVKAVSMLEMEEEGYKTISDLVENMHYAGIVNEETGKIIDLSRTDRIFASYAINQDYNVTTADKNLAAFLIQQFEIKNYTPLEILNEWIKGKLVDADDTLLLILEDWIRNDEPVQPKEAIREFESLTHKKYPSKI